MKTQHSDKNYFYPVRGTGWLHQPGKVAMKKLEWGGIIYVNSIFHPTLYSVQSKKTLLSIESEVFFE